MTRQNSAAWLEGLTSDFRGIRILIAPEGILLGRSQVCDVRISRENVSRQHAKIRFSQGKYYLQDQGSALGTLLNGRPVQASVLNDNDQISIGDAIFRFSIQQGVQPSRQIIPQKPSQVIQPGQAVPYPVQQIHSARQQEDVIAQGAARAIAMNKSFVGPAWIAFAFYYFGVGIVGLVLNIIYLREANKVEDFTGQSPPGKGCLVSLLVVQGIGLAILVIILLITGGSFLDY